MKPIMIIPPDSISDADIKLLRENHLCVVVAKEPALVKFVDSIPDITQRSKVENAAISFSRKILKPGFWQETEMKKELSSLFLDILVAGTPLDPSPSQAEQEAQIFSQAKRDELQRLGREEAKVEREAAKKAKAGASK